MSTNGLSAGINRAALAAFALFAFLCTAGILTMFSQASLDGRRAHGEGTAGTALNPGSHRENIGKALPATIEKGASTLESADPKRDRRSDTEGDKRREEKVLRLR